MVAEAKVCYPLHTTLSYYNSLSGTDSYQQYLIYVSQVTSEGLVKITNFVGSYNVLQQEDPEFNDKRQKLYEYYQPLEFDPTIPLDEKTKLMEEWYVL